MSLMGHRSGGYSVEYNCPCGLRAMRPRFLVTPVLFICPLGGATVHFVMRFRNLVGYSHTASINRQSHLQPPFVCK